MKKNIILMVLLAIGFLFAGCVQVPESTINQNEFESGYLTGVQKFETKEELTNYLKEKQLESISYNYFGSNIRSLSSSDDFAVSESAAVSFDSKTSSSPEEGATSSADYSETNVQVEGVDEADIVKTNGEFIYIISGKKIKVLKATPAEDAEILSSIEFEEKPSNMFIYEDKLVVFVNSYDKSTRISPYSFVPEPYYESKTVVYIFDTEEKEDIKETSKYSLSGNYYDSRMIGDKVYVISQKYMNYYYDSPELPIILKDDTRIAEPSVYYFDDILPTSYLFHTVVGIDITNDELLSSETLMLGYGTTLYMSKDNMYLAYNKEIPYEDRSVVFEKIVLPLLSSKAQDEFLNFITDDSQTIAKDKLYEKIAEILEEEYNSLSEKEQDRLAEDIAEELEKYYVSQEELRQKTVIRKFSLNDGEIEYVNAGEIKGNLLNQFSLDEYDNNLRVATTSTYWRSGEGREQYNNVYVLNSDMETIGSLEKIAEDESIYSTRFIGDKLYMVTFKKVDPFFIIDLSEPTSPEVLGELKLPGFSTYLHPYDENHIIGIGKETKENDRGGVETIGIKVALFDVSDVTSPDLVDSYVIEGKWTDSIALYDHKAFLFDKEKELLVIPVREYKGSDDNYYRAREFWQGAYVLDITEDNIGLRGTISHDEKSGEQYWYYNSPSAVSRSLYIENVLYTISEKKIMMNELEDLTEIGEVDLNYTQEKPDYEIYY